MRWAEVAGVVAMGVAGILCAPSQAFPVEDIRSIQGAFLRGEYESVVRETGGPPGRGAAEDEVLYLRGVSALKLRDWELARLALVRLVEAYPSSRWAPHAWLALSDGWMGSGDPQRALEVLERALREGRAGHLTPQALVRLGKAQRELGLWEEAKGSLGQAARAAPGSSEAAEAQEILDRDDFFFCVQVGSFITRANALRLAQELRRRGYEAEVSEAVMGGKLFHRVRIGRFARRPEAEVEARRLADDGFPARIFP